MSQSRLQPGFAWRALGFMWTLFLLCSACSVRARSVTVGSDSEFLRALLDSSVTSIVLEQDLQFQTQTWADFHSREEPYVLSRNLTIDSSPLLRKIDFSFTGDGRVQLAPTVVLNISNTIVEHARYGAGVQLDFLTHSPGSYLALWNSVMIRMACVSSRDEPEAVAVQPRLSGFPGQQQAHFAQTFCLRKRCYEEVLVYDDYTKLTGTSLEDTAAGGYAIIMQNFTKVCLDYIDNCHANAWSIDNCIRAALDRVSDTPTPGQAAAAEAAAQAQVRVTAVAAGIAAGLGGGMLLLIMVLLLVRRRRWQQAAGEQHLLPCVGSSGTRGSTQDPEMGLPGKDACVALGCAKHASDSACATPPGTQDSWELAASKTSDLFRCGHHQHHSSADLQQFSAPGGNGWYIKGAGCSVNGAAAAACAANDMMPSSGQDSKIILGLLLGAGSFGRVYKGRWRNMDVAVKVLQHSRAAAPSVANEVDLMMSFQHPHVVSAFHFVSWKRRIPVAAYENEESSMHGGVDRLATDGDTNGANDVDGPRVAGDFAAADPEFVDDTQTWIVQEFCDAGSLSSYFEKQDGLRQSGQLPEGHAMLKLLFRLREVAEGMSYLHSRDVVHGDLKSGNVLLSVNPTSPYGRTAKITDFGLSRALVTGQTHRSTHTLGTVSHMAPELLRFGKMSPAVDVFAFGIMMWELLTGQIAFRGLHYGAIIEHVALLGQRPQVPDSAPEDYTLLMRSCWHPDPLQRPAFQQVIKCFDIMITSRQQELVEQKSGSSLLIAAHSGSVEGVHSSGHMPLSQSSGEFDLTITTRSGSRLMTWTHSQQSSLLTATHSQQLTGQGSTQGAVQSQQQDVQQQQQHCAPQEATAPPARCVPDALVSSPYGPQDL